eukprot:5773649-Amphidinium_carterae.1
MANAVHATKPTETDNSHQVEEDPHDGKVKSIGNPIIDTPLMQLLTWDSSSASSLKKLKPTRDTFGHPYRCILMKFAS